MTKDTDHTETARDDASHAPHPGETEHERLPSISLGDPEVTRSSAIELARGLAADKCEHVIILDVRGRSPVTDYVIIGSGTSDRQMNAALAHAEDVGKGLGLPARRTNADDRSTWLLADFVDIVVHLFEPNTRAYYDLEMLWGDAKRVDWRSGWTPPTPPSGAAGS